VTLQHKVALSGLTELDSTSNGIVWSDTFTIITLQKAVADDISPQTTLNLWFSSVFPSVNRKQSIEATPWNCPLWSPFRSLSCSYSDRLCG